MDWLYVNRENISSYNKIKKVIDKINYNHILKYKYKNDPLEENFNIAVLDHINNLEKIIFNNYESASRKIIKLLPIINETKLDEINSDFKELIVDFDKLEYKGKVEIFSYIYWKYKNEKSNEKANLLKIKRVMGLKSGKEYYMEPVKVEVKCPNCNKKAYIFFYNYDLDYMLYKCTNCNHKESEGFPGHDNFDELLKCSCNYCLNIKKELFYAVKDNLKNIINEINSQLLSKYSEIEDVPAPTEAIMEKDFKLYGTILNKNVREVLSFSPSSKEELYGVIDDIEERNSIFNNKNHTNILLQLEKYKVIYNVRKKLSSNKAKNLLFKASIGKIVRIEENDYEFKCINKKIEFVK